MKQEYKISMKLFAFVMALLMLLVSLPVAAFANAISTSTDDTSTSVDAGSEAVKKDVIVLEEDETLREENIKHFKLSDGTTKAVVYSQAVHYKDGDGKWIDIDNALTLNGSEYSSNNKQTVKFANKSGSNGLVSIKDGDYKIDFTPLNTNKVKVEIENPQINNSRKFEDMSQLDNLVSKAIYKNIYDGIDIEYILVGNNIKENIIVKEKQDSYTFSFELNLNKLSAELKDGTIILSDYDSGEQVYEIPAPYMFDANNVYSDNVEYSLVQNNKWKYTFTVTADAEWINAEDRTFPVTIDPSFGVNNDNILDYTGNTSDSSSPTLKVGPYNNSYINIGNLPTLPKSAYITGATISLKHISGNGTYVGVYPYGSSEIVDFNEITYVLVEKENEIDAEGNPVYEEIYGQGGWFTWDVSDIVKDWYNDNTLTRTFKFSALSGDELIEFAAEDLGNESRPVFEISYHDMKGVESYWSYISQNTGFGGTGVVNLATGNLMFEISTLTTTENIFGYTASMIYDSSLAGKNYEYSNTQNGYWYSFAAMGFKLNMNETLIKKSYTNGKGEVAYYYVWADADGTEHYFLPSTLENEENVYYDEDGLQLKLVVDLVDDNEKTYCKIVDSSYNERIFYVLGGAPSSQGLAVYHLERIKDKNGNTLNFVFDGAHKPNDLRFTPSGTTQSTQMFGPIYNTSKKVSLIWRNETKEAVLFRHSDTPTGDLNPTGGIYLREALYLKCDSNISWRTVNNEFISDFDNEYDGITVCAYAKYEYDANGRLISVYDAMSEYKLEYTYSNGKVVQIKEYGKDNVQGQTVGISYYSNYTEVRTSGSDDIYGTNDDLINVYVFDSQGRAITVYSTDSEKTVVYGAQMGAYEENNDKAKNNIKSSAVTGSTSANYLLNGNFEDESNVLNHWETMGDVTTSNTSTGWRWNYNKAILNVGKDEVSSISQQVKLFPGEYCLAVYIHLPVDDNALLTLKALNLNSDNDETEMFTVTNNTNYVYMPFTVEGNSGTLQTVNIVLEATCPDGPPSDKTKSQVFLDDIMLSKSTGAQDYNFVLNGSFDQFTTEELQSNGIWNLGENGTIVQHQNGSNSSFGKSLKIEGNVLEEKSVVQTVIRLPEDEYLFLSDYDFIVSGFAKAPYAMNGNKSVFAIRVDMTCLINGAVTTLSQHLKFQPGVDGWQYTGGIIEILDEDGNTLENVLVNEIKISCVYSHNYGTVYFDNISFEIDQGEKTTKYYYYEDTGRLKGQIKGNQIQAYMYDENGNIICSFTKKSLTDYTYDDNNNIVEEKNYTHNTWFDPASKNIQGIYDNIKNKIGVENGIELESTTKYSYNTYGLLTETSIAEKNNAKNLTTKYTYETSESSKIFGALLSSTDSLGGETRYFYNNKNGDLIAVIEPDGTGLYYTYDDIGNLTMVQPATYSSSNAQKVENSTQIEYEYDEAYRLSEINANGTIYTFTYDKFGNQSSISVGNTSLVTTETNAYNGKVSKKIYADGTEISYEYDTLERVSNVTYTKGDESKEYTYTYDTNGNLVMFTDGNSETTEIYRYDAKGNLVYFIEYDTVSYNEVMEARYVYDDESRLTSDYHYIDYLYSSTVDQLTLRYQYQYNNEKNLLTNLNILYDTFSLDSNAFGISYEYDEFYRYVKKTLSASTGAVKNKVEYQYVTKETTKDDGTKEISTSNVVSQYKSTIEINGVDTSVTVFNYTYDASNLNITEIKNGSTTLYKYTYDSLDRLVKEENYVLDKQYEFTYDNNGNILTSKEYAIGEGNNLTLLKQTNYTYSNGDWKDQLVEYEIVDYTITPTKVNTYQIEYDSVGNPTNIYLLGEDEEDSEEIIREPNYKLTWDNIRELVEFENNEYLIEYEYDGNGIRTSKTVNGVKHTYVVEGTKILSEAYNDVLLIYLYDELGMPIGFSYRDSSNAVGVFEKYFFTKNLQGDIIEIYKEDGTKVASYNYDAWGNHSVLDANGDPVDKEVTNFIGNINPFRYRGYYFDSETNFYYLNSRYYNPQVKRFISADSINYLGANGDLQAFNLYAYCSNNPVMNIDPMGNFNWGRFAAAVAITLAVVLVVTLAATVVASALVTANIVASTIAVAGTTTAISTTTAVTVASATAGVIAGGFSIADQISERGDDNIDLFEVGLSAGSASLRGATSLINGPLKVILPAIIGGAEGGLIATHRGYDKKAIIRSVNEGAFVSFFSYCAGWCLSEGMGKVSGEIIKNVVSSETLNGVMNILHKGNLKQ